MEVRPRRVGGATYQVPMEVDHHRQFALATRWIIGATKARSGKSFAEKLAAELMEASTGQGAAVTQTRRSSPNGRSQPRFLSLPRLISFLNL